MNASLRFKNPLYSLVCGLGLFSCSNSRDGVATEAPELRRGAAKQLAQASFSVRAEPRVLSPSRVLVVDASCPFSIYALSALVADSARARETAIAYMPQTRRDGAALLETASLECARRDGKLAAYIADRLVRLDSVRRPVLASALRVGMDSLAFLSCVRSTEVASALLRSASIAEAVGVWNLPALIGPDSAWIGTQAVRRLAKQ